MFEIRTAAVAPRTMALRSRLLSFLKERRFAAEQRKHLNLPATSVALPHPIHRRDILILRSVSASLARCSANAKECWRVITRSASFVVRLILDAALAAFLPDLSKKAMTLHFFEQYIAFRCRGI